MWEIKFNKSVPAALESYLKKINFEKEKNKNVWVKSLLTGALL